MQKCKYRTITVRDATYAYITYGDGEPLVCLHGFTGSKRTWEPYFDTFGSTFKVIALDMPGHGDTIGADERTMHSFSVDLVDILDKWEIKKAHILGYSFGGRTALSFALTYPERVKTLTLESASPGLKTTEERKNRRYNDERLAEKIISDGIEQFVHYWENIPLFNTQKKLPENVQTDIRHERLSQRASGLAQSLRHMGTGVQPSWWKHLDRATFPVLLITGSLDDKFVRINEEMAKRLPEVTHITVKHAGHAVHVEQAQKFVKIVMTFISENKERRRCNK